jgi:hypothetical protein
VYLSEGVDLRWFEPPPESEFQLGFRCQFLVTMPSSEPTELQQNHPLIVLLKSLIDPFAVCCEGGTYRKLNYELVPRGIFAGVLERKG